jgi:hypothetical protein
VAKADTREPKSNRNLSRQNEMTAETGPVRNVIFPGLTLSVKAKTDIYFLRESSP